jgi:hypothetical protein
VGNIEPDEGGYGCDANGDRGGGFRGVGHLHTLRRYVDFVEPKLHIASNCAQNPSVMGAQDTITSKRVVARPYERLCRHCCEEHSTRLTCEQAWAARCKAKLQQLATWQATHSEDA